MSNIICLDWKPSSSDVSDSFVVDPTLVPVFFYEICPGDLDNFGKEAVLRIGVDFAVYLNTLTGSGCGRAQAPRVQAPRACRGQLLTENSYDSLTL